MSSEAQSEDYDRCCGNDQKADGVAECPPTGNTVVTNNYIKGDQAIVTGDITANNVNIFHNASADHPSNSIFDNIVTSTWKRIGQIDPSKHVSTLAERHAHRLSVNSGRICIKGKSGSGKSQLGIKLLQRIAKETGRKPVELSSWHQWDLIPKSPRNQEPRRTESNDRTVERFHYVVLIDDIFGSGNLVKTFVDDWIKIFDKMWPDVVCGDVLLVLTSRPEISALCGYEVQKYHLMKNMNYIDLDEGTYSLTLYEKFQMLRKICDNCFNPSEMFEIANTDTSLGFPQCCHFYSRSEEAKRMHDSFFKNPHRYVLEEVNRLWECDAIAYLVLLIVLMKGGFLDADNLRYRTTGDFKLFVENLRECCRLSENPTLGYIKDKADALCGVYLTETDQGYTFQHHSIFDAVFLSISKRDPDMCIDICPARTLLEFVRTGPVEQGKVEVCLTRKHYSLFAQRITELLLSEEYNSILDHPCLCDEDFVQFVVKRWISEYRLTDIVMRNHTPVLISTADPFKTTTPVRFGDCLDSPTEHNIRLFSYSTVFAGIILKKVQVLVRCILTSRKTFTEEKLRSCPDFLQSAIYIEDNHLIHTLLHMGAKPNEECLRVLCQAMHVQTGIIDEIFAAVKETVNEMEDLEVLLGLAVKNGNTHLVEKIFKQLEDANRCQKMAGYYLETFIAKLAPYQQQTITCDPKVISNMVNLLLATGCDFSIDKLVWLAASHYDSTVLKLILKNPMAYLNKAFEHKYKSDPMGERAATTTYPSQMTKPLHQAAAYGAVECVAEVIEHYKKREIPASTIVNEATEKVSVGLGKLYPLHLAAMYGKTENMRLLIKSGADVDSQNSLGQTALHFALLYSKLDAVKLLLDKKASASVKDYQGHTAVSYVYGDPNCSTTKQLRCLEVVMSFLDAECDLTAVDGCGRTILHRAATFQDKETVEFLCANGFDVNQTDKHGCTVLHTATQWCGLDIVKLLCEKGADKEAVDELGRTILHIGAKSVFDPVDKLRYFIDVQNVDVNTVDIKGRTVLFDAVRSRNVEVVDYIIQTGVDVNHTDKEGTTVFTHINPNDTELMEIFRGQCYQYG